jgi:hypothetical protein
MPEAISTHTPSRRLLLALTGMAVPGDFISEGLAAAGTSPTSLTPHATDARLLTLLEETRIAEAVHYRACLTDDDAAIEAALERLQEVLEALAETPAAGWHGIAVKAARICRSLRDGGHSGEWGHSVNNDDVAVAESLAADLARLAPEVVA